jgi:hypothetical protein
MKLPTINPDRPKIAVRRLVQFQQRTFLSCEQNRQVHRLKLSIQSYEGNRGTQSAAGSLAHVHEQISTLEAML